MKILQVIPTYAPAWCYGGPIRAVHEMSTALARRGHEVHVYTTDGNGAERLPIESGVPVVRDGVTVRYFAARGPRRLHFAPAMGRALARSVGEFDVVHLHSVFLWPTAAAARAATRAGVPYVVSPRGMLVKELVHQRSRLAKEAWIRMVEGPTLARAAAVHVTSELEQRELLRFGLRLPRIERIPNGVTLPRPLALASPSASTDSARLRDVLFLGRLHPKKRVDLLLRALALVPGATATLVGPDDGARDGLVALRDALGLGTRVEICGPAYDDEKSELMRGHRLLAITSIQENFGNVVLEAMAHGLPVVSTDQVGAAELVLRHDAGRVCGGHEQSVADALRALLSDLPALREMSGRARVASRAYSWDRVAGSFEGCYERVGQTAGRTGLGEVWESSAQR